MYEYNGKPIPEFLRIMGAGVLSKPDNTDPKSYMERSKSRELCYKPRENSNRRVMTDRL